MRPEAWEPLYLEILDDFGFSRRRDEEAADLLLELLRRSDPQGERDGQIMAELSGLLKGRAVAVCGNAPSLAMELREKELVAHALIAADGATSVLLRSGISPDVIVTDLDGDPEDILRAEELGSIVVVHAHGDNLDALREWVPRMVRVLGTVQSRPMDGVHNFGGFTDGDRCVFLARHFGAGPIKLIGFDFDDPGATPRKQKKLAWARRLVEMALGEG